MSAAEDESVEIPQFWRACDACSDAAAENGQPGRVFTYEVTVTRYKHPLNGLAYVSWTCPVGHHHDQEAAF